jgi:hypothetical protein
MEEKEVQGLNFKSLASSLLLMGRIESGWTTISRAYIGVFGSAKPNSIKDGI